MPYTSTWFDADEIRKTIGKEHPFLPVTFAYTYRPHSGGETKRGYTTITAEEALQVLSTIGEDGNNIPEISGSKLRGSFTMNTVGILSIYWNRAWIPEGYGI